MTPGNRSHVVRLAQVGGALSLGVGTDAARTPCCTSGNVPAEGTDAGARLEDIEAMPRVIYIHSNGERNEVEVPIPHDGR